MNKHKLIVLLGVCWCLGAEAPLSLKNSEGQWLLLPPLVIPNELSTPVTSPDLSDMQLVDTQFVHDEVLELPPVIQEESHREDRVGSYSAYMKLHESQQAEVTSPAKPD
jgi:hypothetical protein